MNAPLLRRAVWDEWRAGDRGSTSETLGRGKGMFKALNMQVYANGTLGPRPGWLSVGTDGNENWVEGASGDQPLGFGWADTGSAASPAGEILVIYDDTTAGNDKIARGGIGGSPLQLDFNSYTERASTAGIFEVHAQGYRVFYQSDSTPLWFWVGGPGSIVIISAAIYTAAQLASADDPVTAASAAVPYRDRVYQWGDPSNPGRLYYTEAADTSTSAGSVDLDAGTSQAGEAIVGCWPVASGLLIARRDHTWFVMTGANPITGVIREIGRGPVPAHPLGAVIMDNAVWFLNPQGTGIVRVTPGTIDTETFKFDSLTRSTLYPLFQPEAAAADEVSNYALFPFFQNGFSKSDLVMAASLVNNNVAFEHWYHNGGVPDVIMFAKSEYGRVWAFTATESGGAFSDWSFWVRDICLNRPANELDTYSDLITNEGRHNLDEPLVELSEVQADPGHVIRPKAVIVDFDYWKQTNPSSQEFDSADFDIDVTILGIHEDTTTGKALTTHSVDSSGWANSPTVDTFSPDTTVWPGVRKSYRATFELSLWGSEIKVEIKKCTGIALRRVVLEYETREEYVT